MLQDREPYIWDALLDRYSPSGGRARPEQHSNHLAKEANSWAVRVLLNPSLNSLDRSQPPCPTQRDQHRQSVFLVEFNSAPSPRPLSHVANFHTHVSTPETLMPDGRKIWVL